MGQVLENEFKQRGTTVSADLREIGISACQRLIVTNSTMVQWLNLHLGCPRILYAPVWPSSGGDKIDTLIKPGSDSSGTWDLSRGLGIHDLETETNLGPEAESLPGILAGGK